MSEPRHDTERMSLVEINALRLASALDRLHVDPDEEPAREDEVCGSCGGNGCASCAGKGIVSHG